jgi:hypothetical protein
LTLKKKKDNLHRINIYISLFDDKIHVEKFIYHIINNKFMIYIININNIKLDMINIFYNICENNNYDEIVFKLDKNIKY